MRTCFQCGYDGYTGGLAIGDLDESGVEFRPRVPIRGFRTINLFCAFDESIFDRDEAQEYSFGWSENFGTGDDGARLEYVRGRIVEGGPERVIVESENAGGCYRVTKVAFTRAGAAWWILATRITNRCDRPVRFDYFTGDDPWLGSYRSSDGDVGWTPAGLVEREADVTPFVVGGFYDLGNPALGQDHAGFSNQANFVRLDPASPLPDRALFANRFAHSSDEIDPLRPLDNRTMTALNLGWTDRTLRPGEGFTVAMAIGRAETGVLGETPRPPAIDDGDWSEWRRVLPESDDGSSSDEPDLAAEDVALDLSAGELRVHGTYWIRNNGDVAQTLRIRYPILVGSGNPPPPEIIIDGRRLEPTPNPPDEVAVEFPLPLAPRGLARFEARYAQRIEGREAVYLTTSAREWSRPIGRAVFVVRHDGTLPEVTISYPVARTRIVDGVREDVVVLSDFSPVENLAVRWQGTWGSSRSE
ncbi:MAG: hypothetical protein HY905_03495 [Deltaproteobacteria bacterium]|nr:hypothetical protein [Deltaproteobacteria bacterium]